jgi:hypothetical protein
MSYATAFGRPLRRWLGFSAAAGLLWLGCAGDSATTTAAQDAAATDGTAAAPTLAEALAARIAFWTDRRTIKLSEVSVPAAPDAFTQQHNIATYHVMIVDIGHDAGVQISVNGFDAAGAATFAADLALNQAAIEALHNANRPPPEGRAESKFFKGILFRQAASASGASPADLAAGLEASLPASLRAAGALPPDAGAAPATAPSALALQVPGQTSPPIYDDNDRSVLAPCSTMLLGVLAAALGCPAIFSGVGTWVGIAACGGGLLAAASAGPSCLCAAGVAPFGSETWNSSLGMGPEFCSCARTTGNAVAWLGQSPRSPGDASCRSCAEGWNQDRRLNCDATGCYIVSQDRCVTCPLGTHFDPISDRCECWDGSEPRALYPIERLRQTVADCPNTSLTVAAVSHNEYTGCQETGGFGFECGLFGCTAQPRQPGLGGAPIDLFFDSNREVPSWHCDGFPGSQGSPCAVTESTTCRTGGCGAPAQQEVGALLSRNASPMFIAEIVECMATTYPDREILIR